MAARLSPNLEIDSAVERAHDIGDWALSRIIAPLRDKFDAAEIEFLPKRRERALCRRAILFRRREIEFMRDEHRVRRTPEQTREIAVVVKRKASRATDQRHRHIKMRKSAGARLAV